MIYLQRCKLNWINIIFFLLLLIIAVAGTFLLYIYGLIQKRTLILLGIYMVLTGLAITAGYHRLLAHKSYKAVWPLKFIFLLLGAGAFQGSALEWCSDHRNHHRYVDTENDPYGINKGFWYAHIGWLFQADSKTYNFSNVEDLKKDTLISLQNKHYIWLATFMGFILPTGIATLWGDSFGGFIIAGTLRMTLNHHATFAINSVCHYFGKRTYTGKYYSARDNWFTALITYGEGYHNFHHHFPMDYRNGIRFFHYDPTKWLIKSFSWIGLTRDLRCVSEYRIIHCRIQSEKLQLVDRLTSMQGTTIHHFKVKLETIHRNIIQVLAYVESLEKEYLQIRRQKYQVIASRVDEYHLLLKSYQCRLKIAQRELRNYLSAWQNVLINYKKFLSH